MVEVSVEVVENGEDIKVEVGRNVRPTTEVEERDKADLAMRRANMFNRVLISVIQASVEILVYEFICKS